MKIAPQEHISVIIVNYNTVDDLQECLTSAFDDLGSGAEVIVVDNHSHDGSVAMVKQNFPQAILVANDKNLGFSAANNLGLKHCSRKYVHFLNPDTIVQPGTHQAMWAYMEAHPTTGLAGARLLNNDGTGQSSIEYRYPGQRYASSAVSGLPGEIAWILGASMIARYDCIHALGGFDERYFLYGEDLDICLNVRKAGYEIGYIPDASIVHHGGRSERNTANPQLWEKKLKAELRFYSLHYPDEAVKRIARKNRLQARWRLLTLKLTRWLMPHRKSVSDKIEKYHTQLKVFHRR